MAKDAERFAGDVTCLVTAAVFAVALVVLAVRLKTVQVDESADYSYEKARQSVRRVQTAGGRGLILDRSGRVLAGNRPCESIVCYPAAFQRPSSARTIEAITNAIASVAAAVGCPAAIGTNAVVRHLKRALAQPLVVWRDVDAGTLARFAERQRLHPGFDIVTGEERVYPEGPLAAHLLGYVGRERAAAGEGDEKINYFELELRGRAGLERYYDSFLSGAAGERKILVDARGYAIRAWTSIAPRRGPDLRLTLDVRIQRAVERELAGLIGACVVLDPRDGAVLALASAPGFDPNRFVPTFPSELYARYSSDSDKPLLNRATGGAYAPGSTFKPVTALAGLDAGYPEGQVYECSGVFELGGMRLRCSRRWGHGPLVMVDALRESCNPFFCNLGCDIGTNRLIRAARAFGLGAKTGIDFVTDFAGVVPDAGWKMRTYGERWYPGDVAQMSIGQGMLLVSPLQMAVVAGALGTGRVATPRLKADAPVRTRPLPFDREYLEVVREGMRRVVDGGTGRRGGEGVRVAVCGKTGTAEVGSPERRRKNTWFIAYAPAAAPTVAVAMVIENGQSGGGTTAPKVANVLKEIFGS